MLFIERSIQNSLRIFLILTSLLLLSSKQVSGQTQQLFDLIDSTNHYFVPVTFMHYTLGDSTIVKEYNPSETNSGYYLHFYWPKHNDPVFSIIFLNQNKNEFTQHTHSITISEGPDIYESNKYIDIHFSGLYRLSIYHKMLSSPNGDNYLINDLDNARKTRGLGTCKVEIKLNRTTRRLFFKVIQLSVDDIRIHTEGYLYPRKEEYYRDLLNEYLGLPILNH